MGCCGNKRANWRNYSTRPAPSAVPEKLQNPQKIYYNADEPYIVKGAVTGFTYLFSDKGDALEVDERDAADLMKAGYFTQEPL
ncbi:MAG: hypothetical protein COV35_07825 [Alphaproteobacteria bacterium CG11_big_fil_rev_8_21_14_0_20_39_49]|nr:MAG: hypothetical protein COV35_07825 [Alphaproteobacteria bacterium CG11_big_fil_rev_8_21_14_0_20_39_49]